MVIEWPKLLFRAHTHLNHDERSSHRRRTVLQAQDGTLFARTLATVSGLMRDRRNILYRFISCGRDFSSMTFDL